VVGGSDAHVLPAVGHVRTHFPGRTAADLRAAIEMGLTSADFDWDTHLLTGPAQLLRIAMGVRRDLSRRHRPEPRAQKPAA